MTASAALFPQTLRDYIINIFHKYIFFYGTRGATDTQQIPRYGPALKSPIPIDFHVISDDHIFCFIVFSGTAEESSIYVAGNGEDRPGCGKTPETPCQSLQGALFRADPGDTILLDSYREGTFYRHCLNTPLRFPVSVNIVGFRGRPRIGCPEHGGQPTLVNMTSEEDDLINVSFTDVIIVRCNILLLSNGLTFYNSLVLDSTIMTIPTPRSRAVNLNITSSFWIGTMDRNCNQSTNKCHPSSSIQIATGYLKIDYHNTTFLQTTQKFNGGYAGDMHISNCLVSNDMSRTPAHGTIYLTVDGREDSTVIVEDSRFEHQFHFDPVNSVMNLYDAPVMIRSMTHRDSNASVDIRRNDFFDNERGLTFIADFRRIQISDCTFRNNIAMHAGAGILLLTEPHTKSYIYNSSFSSNAAGAFRPENIVDYLQSFQVQDDEVRIHSTCCKGVISFVGKGGGIRVQRGQAFVTGCRFVNNTARLLGGAIFVDRESKVTIEDTYFENSADHRHSMQGDLLYSDGRVQVKSARMLSLTSQNHVAMLRHSGDHWSIEVTEVSVQCPIGYRLRVTNTSAYGVSDIGLKRSYKMDQLSYFCESCPRNKYSLDFGYLNYSLVYSSFAYYTLLINGQQPTAAYNGTYVYHDIECLECPYGARCQEGITAVPNFWGYVRGNTIAFQHCPKGYCCSSTHCPKYNMCAHNRAGRICGECIEGYSEALFSAECVPDENCDATWLWPFTVASGLLYTLFLLFQKDVRDLMFTTSVSLKDIPLARRRTTARYEMNNIIHNEDQARSPLRELAELDNLHNDSEMEADGPIENNNQNKTGETEDEDKKAQPPTDMGASFLIILFYYFQDAQLLHIKTVFASSDSKSKNMIKTILSGLFKFRIELFQFMEKICFISGMQPSTKLLAKSLVVPYVIFQFGCMYLICRWCNSLRGSLKRRHNTMSQLPERTDQPAKKTFLTRLSQGFVLALLFTYQKLASTSFTLLNCVKVGDSSVLFIEGTVTCYQVWQWGIMAYSGACIVPFCLALLLGPGLLKEDLISLPQFFCACICPLPFLFYWLFIRLRLKGQKPAGAENHQLSSEAAAVTAILQGPFKDSGTRYFGPTCGQGVLIGRRLVLVMLNTFVNDPLIRMLCMMLVCFIILLHHVHVLPYKDTKGNLAGSASAAALLMVGGINLVRAGFEAAEYVPQGPNEMLMQVFEEVENVLMLWFPLGVMSLIFIALSVKIFLLVLKCLLAQPQSPPHVTENTHTESTTL